MQTWVERLIIEYSDGKRQLEGYRLKLDLSNPLDADEVKTVTGMITDLQNGIEHMRTGGSPWRRRGVESRDVYRRAALMDMDLFPAIDFEPEEMELTEQHKRQLVDVLLKMSKRERQCYLLHKSQGLSYAEIAKQLKISKATVQTNVKRARGKVQQGL